MSDILEVASQTEEYVGSVERWKADHQAAMLCFEVEQTVALGIRIFDAIVSFDENWRRRVIRGELQYSPVIHGFIHALFQRWQVPCAGVLAAMESLQDEGHLVNGADGFLQRRRETEGLLTGDAEFFSGNELVQLRDEALDQHLRGETLEHGPG